MGKYKNHYFVIWAVTPLFILQDLKDKSIKYIYKYVSRYTVYKDATYNINKIKGGQRCKGVKFFYVIKIGLVWILNSYNFRML